MHLSVTACDDMAASKPKSDLPTAIRALRTDRGLTQEALAFASGITVGHLSKIERGVVSPRWNTVEAIAGALGATMTEVARRAEQT
jgi:XRE family transcriptional regulator, regulator of sulfur utilization